VRGSFKAALVVQVEPAGLAALEVAAAAALVAEASVAQTQAAQTPAASAELSEPALALAPPALAPSIRSIARMTITNGKQVGQSRKNSGAATSMERAAPKTAKDMTPRQPLRMTAIQDSLTG